MNVDFRIKKENPRIVETTTKMKVGTTIDNEVVPDTGVNYTIAGDYVIGGSDLIGRMRSIGYTDGKVVTELSSRNMTTAGTTVNNIFKVIANKDGSTDYYLSDESSFREKCLKIKTKIKSIILADCTWKTSANGKYYTDPISIDSSVDKIIAITLIDFTNLRASDEIQPMIYYYNQTLHNEIRLMANTSTFINKAGITINVLYIGI